MDLEGLKNVVLIVSAQTWYVHAKTLKHTNLNLVKLATVVVNKYW